MRRFSTLLVLVLSLCAALPAAGQLIVNPTISGSSISVSISLPLGLGGADLSIGFEEVTGLSLANLGLGVQVVNPLSPALRARLPTSVGPALPVLVRIEPPTSGTLAFHGVATIDFHTTLLHYVPGTRLRLFSAPLGGPFEDVTAAMGSGSYRAQSTKGGFSELLVVWDMRTVDQVIADKFDRLEDLLDGYESSMPGSVYDDLEELLEDAHAAYTGGSTAAAIAKIDELLDLVEEHSGTDIPEIWRAARDVDNVAGYLRGAATTLRFSLVVKSGA
jgi:hypothetical protein